MQINTGIDPLVLGAVVIIYMVFVLYLGYLGYRRTKTSEDYMVAGRKIHPVILSISYGATFISTSAIVGFGGTAGVFGASLLWLTFLNIFVGIFIAFVFFGKRTRRMGKNLGSVTFPELLGRRFQSRGVQGYAGALIAIFMPLYAGIVLIGGARFIESALAIDYSMALVLLLVIVAIYVVVGGLMAVMYTDALQGAIMFVGMVLLLFLALGAIAQTGSPDAMATLTSYSDQVPQNLINQGHRGWTATPELNSQMWWTVFSTIVMGVGIGVLAQPQLAMRFMTVKNDKALNRAVVVGGIFILAMTGIAFTVGALSNVYYINTAGVPAIAAAGGNVDLIIPNFITASMPAAFVAIFMVTLLAAAMSTLSSQFHTMGTAVGRDIYSEAIKKGKRTERTVLFTRVGMVVTIAASAVLAFVLPISVIARATGIFFGLCATAFLPSFVGALYWKRMTRAAALWSMVIGTAVTLFWLVFIHASEAKAMGISQALFGLPYIGGDFLAYVDPLVVALPISTFVAIAVTLATRQPDAAHLNACFAGVGKAKAPARAAISAAGRKPGAAKTVKPGRKAGVAKNKPGKKGK